MALLRKESDIQTTLRAIREDDGFDLDALETLCQQVQGVLGRADQGVSTANVSGNWRAEVANLAAELAIEELQRVVSIESDALEEKSDHADSDGGSSSQLLPAPRSYARKNRTSVVTAKPTKQQKQNKRSLLTAEQDDVNEHYLGEMSTQCSECKALHFKEEFPRGRTSAGDCCAHGKVLLDWDTSNFPDELRNLFERRHALSRKFHDWIRNYNSALSFASINCKQAKPMRGRAPYIFRIHGQLYTMFNTAAHPTPGSNGRVAEPSYGQLYVIDTAQATALRMKNKANEKLDADLMAMLGHIISEHSPHADAYRMLCAVEAEVKRDAVEEAELLGQAEPEVPEMFLCFRKGRDRTYDLPSSNEVAAVFVQRANGEVPPTELVVYCQGGRRERLSTINEHVDPFTFPLFFPRGELGWRPGMRYAGVTAAEELARQRQKRKKRIFVSRREFVSARMAIRDGVFNPILHGGKLMQEYSVVQYVHIESDRVQWIRQNQNTLKAGDYKLKDTVQKACEKRGTHLQKFVIMPASHPGSPRYMRRQYEMSMSLVARYGKPDLFLTATCNPAWLEIADNLKSVVDDGGRVCKQASNDRPDLVVRVFDLKRRAIIHDIVQRRIFGKVQCYVCVIEFQKRGLPHMHMLITLAEDAKLTTTEKVDRMIRAEVPDPNEDPVLYERVKEHMVHGPCDQGEFPCQTDDGRCDKKFPKPFREMTSFTEDGYPKYRRREDGPVIHYGANCQRTAHSGFVVPYNPYLLKKYNCHLNVEAVGNIKAVKYLYKYCYKGFDKAMMDCTMGTSTEWDELKSHVDGRFVSAPDALWRIFGKSLQGRSHTVVNLHVHEEKNKAPLEDAVDDEDEVPDENEPSNEVESADVFVEEPEFGPAEDGAEEDKGTSSTLLAWFKLNAEDPRARDYYYYEIPEHFRWRKDKGVFVARKVNWNVIGRIHCVGHVTSELYHLRVLLLHVKGATSYKDLMHYDGVDHDTYGAACVARKLTYDDTEWDKCLAEAVEWRMPGQLRWLFASILAHCNPKFPEELLDKYMEPMSDDYVFHEGLDGPQAQRKAYAKIVMYLREMGKSQRDFPSLPDFDSISLDKIDREKEQAEADRRYRSLNAGQLRVVDFFVHLMDSLGRDRAAPSSKCAYLGGEGGTGKTWIYALIYHLARARGLTVINMASTGIAATLLAEGRTVHKAFNLPVPLYADSKSGFKVAHCPREIREASVFVWDECPMSHRYALEAVDQFLQEVRNCPGVPFGGAIMLCGGDFRQCLPVQKGAVPSELIDLSVKSSELWQHFREFNLTQNMRAQHDAAWATYLRMVGEGVSFQGDYGEIQLPKEIISNGDLVDEIYGDMLRGSMADDEGLEYLGGRAILAPLNADCDKYNAAIVDQLPGPAYEYHAENKVVADSVNDGAQYPSEFLNSLDPTDIPPQILRLKPGSVVMLTRNVNVKKSLCNGVRLIIVDCGENVLKGKILTGPRKGKTVALHRFTLKSDGSTLPFCFTRHQFPVRLAFCLTINKGQGQTFQKCGVDLRNQVFTHGQAYVALSRVGSSKDIRVLTANGQDVVVNIVHKQILNS